MLTYRTSILRRSRLRRRQDGVVMLVALIVLVVMTLAGIAMMRSMDTSTMIAGNMAFKQAATHASDTGIESAVAWLETNNAINNLDASITTVGYSASSGSNADYPLGEVFWKKLEPAGVCHLNSLGQGCVSNAEANANGNRISYMIQRLCQTPGDRNTAGCAAVAGTVSGGGQNEGAGEERLEGSFAMVYYRITVRVEGPRNSISYVQSIVYL
jgi:Tfp pilus assembly protein PilX